MSDHFDDEFDEEPQPKGEVLDPNIRRQLRQAEKDRKELEELKGWKAVQERESAFNKAGIPEDKAGALLRKAYDGPLDADAIRRAAEDYGVIEPSAPVVDEEVIKELEALRKAQGATVGTTGTFADPAAELNERMSKATDAKEIMALIREGRDKGIEVDLPNR